MSCQKFCAGVGAARPGATIVVRGTKFGRVDSVIFLGGPADDDDASVVPLRRRKDVAVAQVPATAASGPVAVVNRDGAQSDPSPQPLVVDASGMTRGDGLDVAVQNHKVFFDGVRPARLTYMVHGDQPQDVGVELVRLEDNLVIARWFVQGVGPNTPQSVTWDGTAGGVVQRDGRYAFRVAAASPGTASASAAHQTVMPASFAFLRHEFPVRGKHDYGGYAAGFGGGRGHQGHDVFAECGTPLVAARGGVVKLKDTQSRAGNYVVIDGEATGEDYVYMHLRDPALVEQGARVRTGQLIGYVGDTGDADGCHLHFELWTEPGWYTGGHPYDPKPALLAWDKTS